MTLPEVVLGVVGTFASLATLGAIAALLWHEARIR